MRFLPKSGSTESSIFRRRKRCAERHYRIKLTRVNSSIPGLIEVSSSAASYDIYEPPIEVKKHQGKASFLRPSVTSSLQVRKANPKSANVGVTAADECRFWSTPNAKSICAIALLALFFKMPVLLHGISVVVVREIAAVCFSWAGFYVHHLQVKRCLKSIRAYLRLLAKESEKAIGGNYARQVVAAYMFYTCTAPGESFVAYLIRYKMSTVNYQVVEELREWKERRLGYEKSERNAFA